MASLQSPSDKQQGTNKADLIDKLYKSVFKLLAVLLIQVIRWTVLRLIFYWLLSALRRTGKLVLWAGMILITEMAGQQKQSISRCRLCSAVQAVNNSIKTKTRQKLFSSGCENQLIRTKLSLQTITHNVPTPGITVFLIHLNSSLSSSWTIMTHGTC